MAFSNLADALRVITGKVGVVPPPVFCERCGNEIGHSGHGPGFCIDRRPEAA